MGAGSSRYRIPLLRSWVLPAELSNNEAYGLWNCLLAFNSAGKSIGVIPAHDGDFFPESPLDYVNSLRNSLFSKTSAWPVRVDVDISQKCTCRCYFCYSRAYADKPIYKDAEIPQAHFERIVAELAQGGTRTIRFTGGGEPLIHPRIRSLIPIPRRYGLQSCIITNGDLLDETLIDALIDNVDQVRLSLNATTNITRQRLHHSEIGSERLEKTMTLVGHMVKRRQEQWPGQRRPMIWVTFLLLPENLDEIAEAAQAMREVGVDSISYRPIYHGLARWLSPYETQIMNDQLCKALELHNPPFFQVFVPKRTLYEAVYLRPSAHFHTCVSCSLRTVLEATNKGERLTLCGLYRGMGAEDSLLIQAGEKFSVIWQDTRTRLARLNRPKGCQNCIDISMNVSLNGIAKVLRECPDAIFRKGFLRE